MILLGVSPLVAVGLILVAVWPPAAIAVFAAAGIAEIVKRRRRDRTATSETGFLTAVASATSAGSTVRQAIIDSDSSFVDENVRRLCNLGRPMGEVSEILVPKLPATGNEFGVILDLSEQTGARIVPAMHQLAAHAADIEQRERERRIAVAQAKYSSLVVGVVPLAVALVVVIVRGVPDPGGALIVVPMVVGAVMMVAGAGGVFMLANRVVV
jgi:Flp pilus assembly protein TadB